MPALDAIAFTGDLTDGGSKEDYALLKDILSPLALPIFVVPGNHDRREALRAAFSQELPFEGAYFLNYEARLDDLRILALDTLIEGRPEGALGPECLSWLNSRLESRHLGPTLLLLHHPPAPSGIASLDKATLVGGRHDLARMVGRCRDPLVILAGHIHRPYSAMWNGAYCAVGGSPAFQMELDLGATEHEPDCVAEPYAYYVYSFETDGNFTVHTRYVTI